MKINLVCPFDSSAMRRMAAPITDGAYIKDHYTVEKSIEPIGGADLYYFLPWLAFPLSGGSLPGKTVLAYTHCNPTDRERLLVACQDADAVVAMSWTGRAELVNLGVDPAKISVIYSAGGDLHFKRLHVGIVASVQPNGRKNEGVLLDLAWRLSDNARASLHFNVLGAGWESAVEEAKNAGLSVAILGYAKETDVQSFYVQMDALLLPGYAEGGPLPMLEGLACGLPIFAPAKVGYAGDFPGEVQTYVDETDMVKQLEEYVKPKIHRHLFSRTFSWRQYEKDHALLFGQLLGTALGPPEDGTERYQQLTELVAQWRCRSLVEIGTWNGRNALRLIQAAASRRPVNQVTYKGFDLFDSAGLSRMVVEGSKSPLPIDVVLSRLQATGACINLVEGDTNKTLKDAVCPADFYFIDGGHSIDTIRNDWAFVERSMHWSAAIVFDDYLVNDDRPDISPNLLVQELEADPKWRVQRWPVITETEKGPIQMVLVVKSA